MARSESELMEGLFGVRHIEKGTVTYKGETIKIHHPRDAIKKGIALLTEDRRATGIFGVLSISDNVGVASLDKYIDYGVVLNNKKAGKLSQGQHRQDEH